MSDEKETKCTYVTRLTTSSPAAIAVIEISGPSAESWLLQCWRPATRLPSKINAIRYGSWFGGRATILTDDGQTIILAQEDVVLCWTKPDTAEIHCHGGKQASSRIVDDLCRLGATLCSAHQRIAKLESDPIVVDALIDLEKATTETTTAILLDQVRGSLSRAIQEIHDLVKVGNEHEANLKLELLQSRQRYGLHLTEPWRVVIAGPPNAGKSRLLNAILGYDRAIVDPTAGTTRDVLNEHTSLLGWPFVVVDTAGLRQTNDEIEHEGVQRALAAIESSDLVLLIVEPQQGWTDWHNQIYEVHSSKCVVVHSKIDLGFPLPELSIRIPSIAVSAQNHSGIDAMYEAIIAKLIPILPQPGDAVPFRKEHLAWAVKNSGL